MKLNRGSYKPRVWSLDPTDRGLTRPHCTFIVVASGSVCYVSVIKAKERQGDSIIKEVQYYVVTFRFNPCLTCECIDYTKKKIFSLSLVRNGHESNPVNASCIFLLFM